MSGPDISVIVPTFNRGDDLQCCLDHLASQSLDKTRFEVLVVDDGSHPPAQPAAKGLRLEVLRQENRGPAAARNHGAAHARGEILAFTDDDCRPQAGWLAALLEAAERHAGALLGGATRNGLQDNPFSEASQLIQDQVYRWYNSSADEAAFFASNNLAAPRRAFLELGGFNPAFRTAEDRDLCDRWRASGRRLRYVAEAEVIHARRLTLGSFVRQHFAYGRGARRYQLAHRARTGRSSVDPGFYRFLLGTLPWMLKRHGRPVTAAALLALWQTANCAGFVAESLRRGGPDAPR